MISIQDSVNRYVVKLRSVLKSDLVEKDLQYKHHKMRKDPRALPAMQTERAILWCAATIRSWGRRRSAQSTSTYRLPA